MNIHDEADEADESAQHPLDDLAAYALDAVDDSEALAIEALLASDATANADEAVLRAAAGEMAAAVAGIDRDEADLPDDLRARVIAKAFEQRAPSEIEPAAALDVHLIELERFEILLHRLTPEQWGLPLDPLEFSGWNIHDLAAHVCSNENLLAQLLDANVLVPETHNSNDARTYETLARHRTMTSSETIAELHAAVRGVATAVQMRTSEELDSSVDWFGSPMPVAMVLVHRSFETWTHADDIRRALGLALLSPPAPSLKTMSVIASRWTPLATSAAGKNLTGKSVLLHLVGPGGGTYHVDLGNNARDLTHIEPDAEVTLDIVDYCRAMADRFPPGGLHHEATGDLELAADIIASLNALALL